MLILCLLLSACSLFTPFPVQNPQQDTQFTLLPDRPESSETAETAQKPESAQQDESAPSAQTDADSSRPDEKGHYTSRDDVAAYLIAYGRLPENFITKETAREKGWNGGGLWDDYCIGGDRFGNREGLLPKAKGRTYYECDIDTMGKDSRGAKRIVYSNDGLIYYTDDHYESFTLIYGEESK